MKSEDSCQDHTTTTTTTLPLEIRAAISHHTVMLKWKPTRRKRRQYVLLASAALFFLLILTFHTRLSFGQSDHRNTGIYERDPGPLFDKTVALWKSLHALIRNNNPQCRKKPDLVIPQNADVPFDSSHVHPRPDLLWLDDADVTRLRSTHANFVSDIRSHGLEMPYEPGTRGIVTIVSEQLLSTLTVSLRMLRKTSSTLPVNIFLRSPSPQSDAFCTKVFPTLNAKCFYLSDIFMAAETTVSLTMHQSRVLSIMFSTFEEVLFLDPCSFPVTAPEPLFHSVPFADTGLVLWPDFWYQSESPYFFDIAKIPNIPPLNTRAASQSNEMLYSKSKHGASLMLATYYNFFGPEYYYLLQSQGGPGAGDKETFGLAAAALDEPAYFVNHPVRSLGRHDKDGNWIGIGMGQFDPVADYFSQSHHRIPLTQPEDIAHPSPEQLRAIVRPMFVHPDATKFDPKNIFRDDTASVNPTMRDEGGTSRRSWMPAKEIVAVFGFDIEKRFWKEIEDSTCGQLLGLWLEAGKPDKRALELVKRRDTELCEKIKKYNLEVFGE